MIACKSDEASYLQEANALMKKEVMQGPREDEKCSDLIDMSRM